MRVIICGVHRTGTTSKLIVFLNMTINISSARPGMRRAMSQLGIYECHHINTVISDPVNQIPQWIKALECKYSKKGCMEKRDWDQLLGRSQACCDRPAALFSAELAQIYPNAKVVMLNRDPEAWYNSVLNTIHKEARPLDFPWILGTFAYLFDPLTRAWINFATKLDQLSLGFDHRTEKRKAVAWFNAQYQEVRDAVPVERRLEYIIKEGWQPLCDFLGLPVPHEVNPETKEQITVPFPYLNDTESFSIMTAQMRKEALRRASQNIFKYTGQLIMLPLCMFVLYYAVRFISLIKI